MARSLALNVTMLDNASDQMGFAILKVPVHAVERGVPPLLKVESEPANSDAWFMTFKSGVREKIDITQNRVVIKSNGRLLHSVSVDFIHVGEDTKTTIEIGDITSNTILKAGYNKVDINLPKVEKSTPYTATIKRAGRETEQIKFTLAPVKEWEIFLVQHTHSDIGYTRPQTEILAGTSAVYRSCP